ncbi:MAG: anti-sigma factor [Chthoniobacterales bacterium]
MIDEFTREAAIDFLLGTSTDAEHREFQFKLDSSAELRAYVEDLREDLAQLAHLAPPVEPPPALRENILKAVREHSHSVTEASTSPAPDRTTVESSSTGLAWLPWAVAAAFAIFAGILWTNNQSLLEESRELATQTAISEDLFQQVAELEGAQRTAAEALNASEKQVTELADRNSRLAEKNGDLDEQIASLLERSALAEMQIATLSSQIDASYLASIAWSPDEQTGVLHVRRLPEAERGKDYQLWVLDKSQAAPISAGVFRVEADGSATIEFTPTQKVSPDSSFAVSVEKSGGSPAPEGPIILAN